MPSRTGDDFNESMAVKTDVTEEDQKESPEHKAEMARLAIDFKAAQLFFNLIK